MYMATTLVTINWWMQTGPKYTRRLVWLQDLCFLWIYADTFSDLLVETASSIVGFDLGGGQRLIFGGLVPFSDLQEYLFNISVMYGCLRSFKLAGVVFLAAHYSVDDLQGYYSKNVLQALYSRFPRIAVFVGVRMLVKWSPNWLQNHRIISLLQSVQIFSTAWLAIISLCNICRFVNMNTMEP